MAAQNIPVDLYYLFGGGDEATYDAIKDALDAGRNLLSMGGTVLESNHIIAGQQDFTSTSYVAASGWTLPTVTYLGRPITFELSVPFLVNGTANNGTVFRIYDIDRAKELVAGPVTHANAAAGESVQCKMQVPVVGTYDLDVGDEINVRVDVKVTAGTTSVHSYWNNGLFGTTAVLLRAVEG